MRAGEMYFGQLSVFGVNFQAVHLGAALGYQVGTSPEHTYSNCCPSYIRYLALQVGE